eukprot:scaffold65833_cov42-Phaeocystis_antarctica.AAC.1
MATLRAVLDEAPAGCVECRRLSVPGPAGGMCVGIGNAALALSGAAEAGPHVRQTNALVPRRDGTHAPGGHPCPAPGCVDSLIPVQKYLCEAHTTPALPAHPLM